MWEHASLPPNRLLQASHLQPWKESMTGAHEIFAKLIQNKTPQGRGWLLSSLQKPLRTLASTHRGHSVSQVSAAKTNRLRRFVRKHQGLVRTGDLPNTGKRLSVSSPCSINDQGTGSPQSLSNTGAAGKPQWIGGQLSKGPSWDK